MRSGMVSNEYFDKYLFESDPLLLREVAEALLSLMRGRKGRCSRWPRTRRRAVSDCASQVSGLPTLFVRKNPKEYGTRRLAEAARSTADGWS